MGKQKKTKSIQTNLGTFSHNQTHPGIIQAYLKPYVTLTYLKLTYSEPEAYSETQHIHNNGIFRTLYIQNPVNIYDETLIIFTVITIFTNYDYFCKACRVEISILRQFL